MHSPANEVELYIEVIVKPPVEVVVVFVVSVVVGTFVDFIVDSPFEKITTIGITMVAITTTEIHAIMTIMTFPERAPMVTV